MKRMLIFITALAMMSGCTFYQLNSEEITGTGKSSVKNFKDIEYAQNLARPYSVLGQITLDTERRNNKDEIIEKFKRQAAVLGADAVTNITEVPSKHKFTTLRTQYTATAVAYKEESPQIKAPTVP